MGRFLGMKLVTIALLMVVLLIPLAMIRGVISERAHYRDEARQDIARSWTGAQSVHGPLLVIPYRETKIKSVWDENLKSYKVVNESSDTLLYLLPEELKVTANVETDRRKRGLYAVPVYSSGMDIDGLFDTSPLQKLLAGKEGRITVGSPYLAVAVSDTRGLVKQPDLTWDGKSLPFVAGSRIEKLERGIHAPLPLFDVESATRHAFSFTLELRGMESLQFAPVGKNTEIEMESLWPHPSFIGRYLPSSHDISDVSFAAQWQVNGSASDMERMVESCAQGDCRAFVDNTFGVSFIEPVDLYLQAERAVKYAILFILLTFGAFFLFEVMKSLRLHPMQYLLVGMALTLFYLLLISLSEHIAFHWAYLAAALSSSLLIGFYVSGVLDGTGRGASLSAMLLLLYGMLYLILRSEDNAFLMGSLLSFAALAAVMVVTRRLDWYRLGGSAGSGEQKA